jgi:hypothetical protein
MACKYGQGIYPQEYADHGDSCSIKVDHQVAWYEFDRHEASEVSDFKGLKQHGFDQVQELVL